MDSSPSATSDNNGTTNLSTVQHVTKRSSDELLRKFAQMDDDEENDKKKRKELLRLSKRVVKKARRRESSDRFCETPLNSAAAGSFVERRSLLPSVTRRSALLRKLGVGKSQIRAREIRNKSLFITIEKTWRKTVEGASRVFLEKHYNRHRRLINDVV